jgi:hypothetical protein
VLHFSEHAAYGRIEAARAARRFPAILDHLADGSLTLTAVGLLAPHVTPENHANLLAAARHKSKRDVEHLIAALRPLPAVPSSVRKLPAAKPVEAPAVLAVCIPRPAEAPTPTPMPSSADPAVEAPTAAATAPGRGYQPEPPRRPAVIAPLSPERYKVQVTISREAHDTLRRAQDLLRHVIHNGDPAAIFERALTLLVEDLERKKVAAVKRPRAEAKQAPGFASRAGGGAPGSVGPRRGALRARRPRRSLHRARLSRVSPRRPLRRRWRDRCREPSDPMPFAQRLRVRGVVRAAGRQRDATGDCRLERKAGEPGPDRVEHRTNEWTGDDGKVAGRPLR